MSQRVYLIPVDDALFQTFLSAVGQTTEPAMSRLRDAASRQSQLAAMSKQFAARLDEQAFRERNLFDFYARCTALRPYVITEESPAAAAQAVNTLWSLEGDDERR